MDSINEVLLLLFFVFLSDTWANHLIFIADL